MRFDCIERRIASFFDKYGRFISRHPYPFIAIPVLFTLAMCTGVLHMKPITDAVYLFTPIGAESKMERMSIHEKWPLHHDNYIPGRAVTEAREIQVTVLAKDNGNILVPPYSEAVYRLDKFIENRIKVFYEGEKYGYNDLCLTYKSTSCPGNKHVHLLSDLYQKGINITYPTFRMGTEGGYLGSSLGGVLLSKDDKNQTILAGARSWFLIYHLKFYPANTSYVSGLFENELGRQLTTYPEDPYITFTYFHSQTLADELKRNADSLVPRFVVSFSLLVVFSALCALAFVDGSFCIDWVLSKPILSVLGVCNAGMGIVTGIGMGLLIGVPYNDIVAVMPFLVVAVGVDNMFLMVAAVRRTSRSHNTGHRMGECMSEAAVSILITSLTDALSFGVGTITTIPAVQIFCIYTTFAITATFFYQLTFFAALLSMFTRWEGRGLNSVFLCETVPDFKMKGATAVQKTFNIGSRPHPDEKMLNLPPSLPATTVFFSDWFAPVLMNPIVKGMVMIWFVIYLGYAAYGCTQIREGLEPINLLVEDSYAIPHYKMLQEHFWKYGASLQLVVNNAPDMRNSTERARVRQMLEQFATTEHSIGVDSLQYWLTEMELYYRKQLDMDIVDKAFYGQVRHWLSSKTRNTWADDLYWGVDNATGEPIITSFRFLIGLRDIQSTVGQLEATQIMRKVASEWPSYNVTSFMPLWLFTDQYVIVIPNTVQNIWIALLCMIIIAFLLIPQPLCALWVAMACASIDFGVIGYMTLWGVNLDAISMITIIMSIGFSVDYSAHITYGYVVSPHADPKDKIRDALAALGWPLFQGGISTIMAVSVLANVPAYMIVTFFKTVFLSISIGLLHGLVFLPVFLSIFVRGVCIIKSTDEEPSTEEIKRTDSRMRPTSLTISPTVSPIARAPGYNNGQFVESVQSTPLQLHSVPIHSTSSTSLRQRTSPPNSDNVAMSKVRPSSSSPQNMIAAPHFDHNE